MRIASFFVAGLFGLGVSCGQASHSDLFTPSTTTGSQGTTGAGTGGSASTTSSTSATSGSSATTSGSTSATTSASTTGGGAGSDQTGAGGASDTAGAGGAGGEPTTTATGGAGSGTGGTGDAGGGAAGGPPDAGPADANPGNDGPGRIRCGTTTCTAVQQFCCVRGTRATCEPAVGGNCPTNGDRLYCDDRTDCLANQICCAADLPSTSSLADCRLAAVCNGPKAQHLCDPQLPLSCAGMNGVCRADQDSTIDGYPYCH